MSERQKINTLGGSTYIGCKLDVREVPKYCIRNNKVCAYRIKFTGKMNTRSGLSACGYMYYTGKMRNCEPKKCDKYQEQILDTCVWGTIWEEEDYYGDEPET
jgi:hypothetical protein